MPKRGVSERHRCGAVKMFPTQQERGTDMKSVKTKTELSKEQRETLLRALDARFEKNMNRHEGLDWAKVKARLEANTEKLWSLNEMERTGGEPDVVGHDKKTSESSFLIVQRNVPKAAQVFATTVKGWNHGRSIDRKTQLWIWQRPWASSF